MTVLATIDFGTTSVAGRWPAVLVGRQPHLQLAKLTCGDLILIRLEMGSLDSIPADGISYNRVLMASDARVVRGIS